MQQQSEKTAGITHKYHTHSINVYNPTDSLQDLVVGVGSEDTNKRAKTGH